MLDGLGDGHYPCKEIGNRTPLEAAATPTMDMLAREGQTGLMYTVGKGIAPESDIAVISILGYDAMKYYTGPTRSACRGIKNQGWRPCLPRKPCHTGNGKTNKGSPCRKESFHGRGDTTL